MVVEFESIEFLLVLVTIAVIIDGVSTVMGIKQGAEEIGPVTKRFHSTFGVVNGHLIFIPIQFSVLSILIYLLYSIYNFLVSFGVVLFFIGALSKQLLDVLLYHLDWEGEI